MSPFELLLCTLCLHEAIVLPGGEIRRVTLFGFAIAGEVVDREEAARRGAVVATPETIEELAGPSCSGPCEDGRRCQACVEAMGRYADDLIVEAFGEDADQELGDVAPPPPSVPVEQASLFYEPDPLIDEEASRPLEVEDIPAQVLPPAVARLCLNCNGGARYRRGICRRCEGRCVRLWADNREVVYSPPATEEGKLVAGLALADLLAQGIDGRAVQGAHELLAVALRGCTPETRTAVLERWQAVINGLGAVA